MKRREKLENQLAEIFQKSVEELSPARLEEELERALEWVINLQGFDDALDAIRNPGSRPEDPAEVGFLKKLRRRVIESDAAAAS